MNSFAGIIGSSTVIRHVQHLVLRVAEIDSPVLITGEKGTGKELVARAIYEKSTRVKDTFVVVKCNILTEDNAKNDIFGNYFDEKNIEKKLQNGAVATANTGVLFLDEIGFLSLNMQSLLLHFLQDTALNQSRYPKIICSSSKDLEKNVKEKIFREDLYYKLIACSIYLPPLSERKEDIPEIIDCYIDKYNNLRNKNVYGISHDAVSAMLQYHWSYNLRELENLVERIVILKNSGSIDVCDLPPKLRCLITDNIDLFYEKAAMQNNNTVRNVNPTPNIRTSGVNANAIGSNARNNYTSLSSSADMLSNKNSQHNITAPYLGNNSINYTNNSRIGTQYDEGSDIDTFIKKEIDLGNGIDFYRVVEEFENKLISEALRRTNHNKNRAAQLLSMNRTTLVEKLKKRTTTTIARQDTVKTKKNSSFAVYDSLGNDDISFEAYDFISQEDTSPIS